MFNFSDKDMRDMWYGYVLPATVLNILLGVFLFLTGRI